MTTAQLALVVSKAMAEVGVVNDPEASRVHSPAPSSNRSEGVSITDMGLRDGALRVQEQE